MKRKRVAGLAVLTVLGATSFVLPQAARAQQRVAIYVTIEGTKQGAFKGEATGATQKGKLYGMRFNYGVSVAHDTATGQASGKRQHSPVSFTKEWGEASAQLFQAATTNEILKTVVFEFVRANAQGQQYVFQTIRLTNATISSIRQFVGPVVPGEASEVRPWEEVSFTFQSIAIESADGKKSATDSWVAR